MNKRCGYTLIEILMVILLVAMFTGIVASTYRFFMQEGKSERVSVAREMDLLALQTYLRKLIGSIGYGIPATETAFINITDNTTKLEFKSLYAQSDKLAGCWWIVDSNGNKTTMAVDKYGRRCVLSNKPCILLDLNRNLKSDNVICSDPIGTPGYLFYGTSSDRQTWFQLYLDNITSNNTAQTQVCAKGTKKLMLKGTNNTQPLFDCVGGLLFEPIGGNPPTAIRYCMLLQVSGRMTTRREPPLSSTCGYFTKASDEWDYYRWRVIEEVIPLENLKGFAQ